MMDIAIVIYLLIAWAWWLGYPRSSWGTVGASLLWPMAALVETREMWRDHWGRPDGA